MDQYVYEGLVERLEGEAAHNPAAFRSKVLLISCASYLALFATLIGVAVIISACFHSARTSYRGMFSLGAFAVSMIPIFFVVLRVFFMRLQAPEGRRLTRDEAPKLFDVLDKMRRRLKGPSIHHVLIDGSYNAAISQLPRWGLFGGYSNYLILGLPYLLGVPPNEMLATAAHEYGHLCGNHGKLGAWVYRQRRTFGALYEKLSDRSESSWAHSAMTAALDRFMPYYNAYTFVLSRQDEYAADLTATELVGAATNANGLVRDALLGRWIQEEFWPKLLKQADNHPRPVFMPYSAMRTAFGAAYEQWANKERLAEAWRERSGLHDTHPSLRDRVEATGEAPKLPTRADTTAAEVLLGTGAKRLIAEFDEAWWSKQQKDWEARYRYATRSMKRLQELAAQPLTALPLHELQELALLRAEFDTPQAAKSVLEYLLCQPGGPFPKAAYMLGRILLDERDNRGLDQLEQAAANDRSLIESVADLGYSYLLRTRDEQAAQLWWNKFFPEQEGS